MAYNSSKKSEVQDYGTIYTEQRKGDAFHEILKLSRSRNGVEVTIEI